jgi:hypothetical protein
MRNKIDELLTAYEEKRISRRQLIGALLMASAASPLAAGVGQQKPAVNLTGTLPPKNALFRGRIVNHVTLRVKDVDESRRFYQELVGASVLLDGRMSEQTGSIDLLLGDSFVTVSGRPRSARRRSLRDRARSVARGRPRTRHGAEAFSEQRGQNQSESVLESRRSQKRDAEGS